MLREEFDRLMQLFRQAAEDSKAMSLDEIFGQALKFFDQVKEELQTGSPEERKEVLDMLSEMYKQLMEETQRISQTTGLSEEQLLAYAENPGNFQAEQWKTMQESKLKIDRAGQDLVKILKTVIQTDAAAKPSLGSQTGSPPSQPGPSEPPKKPKKGDWMRS